MHPARAHARVMRSPEDAPTDADQLIRLGSVASVDLATARCTVKFDDAVESAPVRWIEGRHGATVTWSPPSVGEQVVLLCPAGEIGAGVALRGLACSQFPPADNRAIDLIRFGNGSVLSYDTDANAMAVTLAGGGTLAIAADGGVSIIGSVAIDGDLSVSGTVTASGDVTGSGISLASHTHSGVQSGGSSTGGPQ